MKLLLAAVCVVAASADARGRDSGACDANDIAIWNGIGQANFWQDLNLCTLECPADDDDCQSCGSECFGEAEGYSTACGDCFGEYICCAGAPPCDECNFDSYDYDKCAGAPPCDECNFDS